MDWASYLSSLLAALLPWALWCVWWLFAVDWRKAWPMLAAGGWVPAVLLLIMMSTAWALVDARPCSCLGFLVVPNGWWQLGYFSMLAALALVCGWLQGQFAWILPEIPIEPPAEHSPYDEHAHH